MRRRTVMPSKLLAVPVMVTTLSLGGSVVNAAVGQANLPPTVKGHPVDALLSSGGLMALEASKRIRLSPNPFIAPILDELRPIMPGEGGGSGGAGGPRDPGPGLRNTFVNDPCLDPPPEAPFPANFLRTVQSETEIAIFNPVEGDDDDDDGRSSYRRNRGGRLMVAGYNDSYGFYDNRQGLSGVAYSTDGGKQWIDASGLPPAVPSGVPAGTPGSDAYFGDPVVVVDNRARKFVVRDNTGKIIAVHKQPAGVFYYASLYQTPEGYATLSVNRGQFRVAPQQVPVESKANTRCKGNPAAYGVPDPPPFIQERIIWEPPVAAVLPPFLGQNNDAFLDKEWLYVDQKTGVLYLTYTRIAADGATPIELVRSFDGGRTWTPPSIIVPNLLDTFNQATMPIVTPSGRVIVTWFARTFPAPAFIEREQRIEIAYSDDCQTPAPCTFSAPVIVDRVRPQGEPLGYNRRRLTILNAPYINVDKGLDDGRTTEAERKRDGFGNVYITYFDGVTELPQAPIPVPPPAECGTNPAQSACNPFMRAANIMLATSTSNGRTWREPQKVNDDRPTTTHVFPSVQVNDLGEVFVTWIDRRVDPRNLLNDTWGEIFQGGRRGHDGRDDGRDGGRRDGRHDGRDNGGDDNGHDDDRRRSDQRTTGARDFRITNVSSDWITREDAVPDFGDYNSSDLIDYRDFISIWADGRFPPPAPLTPVPPPPAPPVGYTRPANQAATPDALSAIIRRGGSNNGRGGDGDRDRDH